jgi:integrase
MLFRVYSRYVPNLTRRDGSAFERLITQSIADTPARESLEESRHV